MKNIIVTYETFHGSAKKVAEIISNKLDCKCINVDTPFEAENLEEINTVILVFNFRGPYTAQLTKLYLSKVKEQLKNKNVILVGEGLFSEKEFPVVAEGINKNYPSKTFSKFFIKGQLRVDTLSPEERALLKKFSEITRIEIKDMGELDISMANDVADQINDLVTSDAFKISDTVVEKSEDSIEGKTKWICPLCGYVHYGDNPPEACPLCGAPGNIFTRGN